MPDQEIIAEGLRFPEGPVARPDQSVLFVEIERGTVSRWTPDRGVEIAAEVGGGPNGLAIGPDGAIWICNNGGFLFEQREGLLRVKPGVPAGYTGGRIERLDADLGRVETLADRCGDHALVGPNDLVFDRHGGVYFSDFGKNYPRHRLVGGLYYLPPDGTGVRELSYGMTMANGVGLSPDGDTVYVSETETGRLWAFDLEAPGVVRRSAGPAPHGGRLLCTLPGYQRLDSLAVEAGGNICVATIGAAGAITVFDPDGHVVEQVPTGDPVTTNICFGGPDLKTAYITLAGTGRLMRMAWPRPGLKLAFT